MTLSALTAPTTQRFRLGATTIDIEATQTVDNNLNGQQNNKSAFVFLEDIQDAFPGARCFAVNGIRVPFMRDEASHARYYPERVPCRPGHIIDIVDPRQLGTATSLSSMSSQSTQSTTSTANTSTDLTDQMQFQLSAQHPQYRPQRYQQHQQTRQYHRHHPHLEQQHHHQQQPQPSPLSTALKRQSTIQLEDQLQAVNNAVEHAARTGHPLDSHAMTLLISNTLIPTEEANGHKMEFEQYVVDNIGSLVENVAGLTRQGDLLEQLAKRMLKLQQEALDRLSLIQRKAEQILTQSFELHEYTIPRLFIILPDPKSTWDSGNLFRNKFRLHFVCECGDHTRTVNTKMPHHLHLALHEGYVIRQPSEFLKRYGAFVRVLLEVIKFGVNVSGFVVPVLSNLKVVEMLDQFKDSCENVTKQMVEGVDRSIDFLDEFRYQSSHDGGSGMSRDGGISVSEIGVQALGAYLADLERIEGVELRRLASFLKVSSGDSVLGNLYRMSTSDGHVRWVCREHFRESYKAASTDRLRDLVIASGGAFDEQLGKVKIIIKSGTAANELYEVLNRTRGILELNIVMHWNQSFPELVAMKNMVVNSRISALTLNLWHETGPSMDFPPIGKRRYDPVLDLLRHSTLKSVYLKYLPEDFFRRSSMSAVYSNLKYLKMDLKDVPQESNTRSRFKSFLAKSPNLSTLHLDSSKQDLVEVYNSITDIQGVFSIYLASWFVIPASLGTGGVSLGIGTRTKARMQDIPQLIRAYGVLHEILGSFKHGELNVGRDLEVAALAFATEKGSNLGELSIKIHTHSTLGTECMERIVANSPLIRFGYQFKDNHSLRVLGLLPWESLQEVILVNNLTTSPVSLLYALISEMDSVDGALRLIDTFDYQGEFTISVNQESLSALTVVLSRLSVTKLVLRLYISCEEWARTIVPSIDFALIEVLYLQTFGYESEDIQVVLDSVLERNVQLEKVVLDGAKLTERQIDMFRAHGIQLVKHW